MDDAPSLDSTPLGASERNRNLATAVYALQACSFVLGVTALIAVVIDYVKLDDVRGSWLESHYRWQIRTFWWGLLWTVVGFVTLVVLVGGFILFANAVWIIYRIVKGWMRLSEQRAVD
ncbi:membrane protein [soil metagenome]